MQLVESLRALLIEQLSELCDGEKRVALALSAWADVCSDPELQAALDQHALETERHITRIEETFEALDTIPRRSMCLSLERLIEEGAAHIKGRFASAAARDLAIITGARRVEHFEVAAYGTAVARARLLELAQVAGILDSTLHEEKAMERSLILLAAHHRGDRTLSREKPTCSVN